MFTPEELTEDVSTTVTSNDELNKIYWMTELEYMEYLRGLHSYVMPTYMTTDSDGCPG